MNWNDIPIRSNGSKRTVITEFAFGVTAVGAKALGDVDTPPSAVGAAPAVAAATAITAGATRGFSTKVMTPASSAFCSARGTAFGTGLGMGFGSAAYCSG